MNAIDLKLSDQVWIFNKDSFNLFAVNVNGILAQNGKVEVHSSKIYKGKFKAEFGNSLNAKVIGMEGTTMHLTIEDAQKERDYHKERFIHRKKSEIRNSIKELKRLLDDEEIKDFKADVCDVFGENTDTVKNN